jgi:hypothetical protein
MCLPFAPSLESKWNMSQRTQRLGNHPTQPFNSLAQQLDFIPFASSMMESLSQRSESSDHTSNTPPRMRYPHPTAAFTPSSPSCSNKVALRGPCDSANSFSIQDSGHRSIRIYGGPHRVVNQQEKGRPAEGDLGKILPPTSDNAMALNPYRWHMVVDKDQSPSSSNTSPLQRSNKPVTSAIQTKRSPHNRWASEGGEAEETQTKIATAERKRHSESQRLERPTRKASGYRASRTPAVSTSAAPTDTSTISVPSVIAVRTLHPRFRSSSPATDVEMPIRRRSFDEIPTLPQRQRSNMSLGMSDDFSSSTPTSI